MMDSDGHYSRRVYTALKFNKNQYSSPKRTLPSFTIKPHRNVLLNYRQDEISANDYTSADESLYGCNVKRQRDLRAPNFARNSNRKNNYEEKDVYDIHRSSIIREQLQNTRCFYNYRDGKVPLDVEDRHRGNTKYIDNHDQAKNIYVRPLTEYYNREYLYKTLQNEKKVRGLAKKITFTREREKQKAAWDIYIKKLKIKHNVADDSQPESSTSKALPPKTRINIDTLEDYYNTKFKTAQSSHCKNLLQHLYSHSIETDQFSTQSSKHTNEYYENKQHVNITNSHTDIHTTAAKIRNVTFINTERNITTPYVFKLNPYLGLPNSPIGISEKPYFSYACSSSGRALKQNASGSCDLGAPKGRASNIDPYLNSTFKKNKYKTVSSRYLMTRSGGNRTSTLKSPRKTIKSNNTRPTRLSISKSNKINPESTINDTTRGGDDGNTKRLSNGINPESATNDTTDDSNTKRLSNGMSRSMADGNTKRPSNGIGRSMADGNTKRLSNVIRRSMADGNTRRPSYGSATNRKSYQQENNNSMQYIAQKLDILIAGNQGINNLKSIDNKLDVLIDQMNKLLNNSNALAMNDPMDNLNFYSNKSCCKSMNKPAEEEYKPSGCVGFFCPCESKNANIYTDNFDFYNNNPERPTKNNIQERYNELPYTCENKSSSDNSNIMNELLNRSISSISCKVCRTCYHNDNKVVQAKQENESGTQKSLDNNFSCCVNGKPTEIINVKDLLHHAQKPPSITPTFPLPLQASNVEQKHNDNTKLIVDGNKVNKVNANNIVNSENHDMADDTKNRNAKDTNNGSYGGIQNQTTNDTNKITNNNNTDLRTTSGINKNTRNSTNVRPADKSFVWANNNRNTDTNNNLTNGVEKQTADGTIKNMSNGTNNRTTNGTNIGTNNHTSAGTNRDVKETIHESPGENKDKAKFRFSKNDKFFCVTIDKCTSVCKGKYSSSASVINEILLQERDKSNKAKQDIEGILNGDRNRMSDMEIMFDVPTKECCTEVTNSLSKAIIQEDSSIESTELAAVYPKRPNKRITIAVNTDPLSLLALLKISTATFGRMLSFVNFDYQSLLPLFPTPRPIVNRFDCNVCGSSFERCNELSEHIHEHVLQPSKECCVYCHTADINRNRHLRVFKCRYCGRSFTRAYCRELHETSCAKKRGVQHDVSESLAILS